MDTHALITAIAEKTGFTKTRSRQVLGTVFQSIQQGLQNDGVVAIIGFGSWTKIHRQAFTGRNPRTSAPIAVPASNQVKFRAGKGLKESVQA